MGINDSAGRNKIEIQTPTKNFSKEIVFKFMKPKSCLLWAHTVATVGTKVISFNRIRDQFKIGKQNFK